MTNIHWGSAIDGAFNNSADWTGGVVPGHSDNAILDGTGAPYKVTANGSATVNGIQLDANATLAIVSGTFTSTSGTDGGVNSGTIAVTRGAIFQTGGVVNNSGGITLSGAGSDLRLMSDTTLTGGGVVSANYGTYGNYTQILGAVPVTLTNVDNTIIGAGQIGGSAGFSLINEAGGVIEADVNQRRLILGSSNDPGEKIVNDGLILAAAGPHSPSSFLEIDHASVSGAGGTIAVGENSNVTILYSQVSGQTFSIARDGVVEMIKSRVALGGALVNPGLIKLHSDISTINGGLTLSGGGEIDIRGGKLVGTKVGTALVNEDDDIVLFKGNLGAGTLTLINKTQGTIVCEGTIDAGSSKITNAGLIESGPNHRRLPGVIMSAIENTGTLSTGAGGTLVVNGAVTGAGRAVIDSNKFGGVLDFTSSFNEDVTFLPQSGHDGVGVLELAQSQAYAATITGFSESGRTSLDLGDIGFVKATKASFSGTTKSGVLTVTDGTHTAHIDLVGDFLASTFLASSDGHGGTSIIAKTKDAASAPAFVSAMAGLGGRSAAPIHAPEGIHSDVRHYLLGPRVQIA